MSLSMQYQLSPKSHLVIHRMIPHSHQQRETRTTELVFSQAITQFSCKISSFPGTIGPTQLAHVRHGVHFQINNLIKTLVMVMLTTTKATSIVRTDLVDMEHLKAQTFITPGFSQSRDIAGRATLTVLTNCLYGL
jgi:hypothetical protein